MLGNSLHAALATFLVLSAPAHEDWKHVTAANNVELNYTTSLEKSPTGAQPFIYLRLHNHNAEPVEGALGVDITCASGSTTHIGWDAGTLGVIGAGGTYGGFPHLYKAVCKPGDAIDRVEADVRFALVASTNSGQAPPEPPPEWVPESIPPPGPLPDIAGGPGAPSEFAPPETPFDPAHPPSSTGRLVEFRYGLAGLAVPVQGASQDYTGFTSNYHSTAGGLGPRITLDVWPYYSRFFAVGLGGIVELDGINVFNGFNYAFNLAGGLRLQAGDEAFFSGLLKVDEGYRSGEASDGSSFNTTQSVGTFGGGYTRVAVDARLCIDEAHPWIPCRRGVDLGVGYDVLAYASNHGGLFLEGAFWMRQHFAVSLEYAWSYPAGGLGVSPKATPWRSSYVSVGILFSDAFWSNYAAP